jgi:hypothetical protein
MVQKKSFLLRLDPALWEELQALAASELRSINGQIEYLLLQAVRERRRRPDAPAPTAPPAPDEKDRS